MPSGCSRDNASPDPLEQPVRLRRSTLASLTKPVWCVAPFLHNGRVASVSDDGHVTVWGSGTRVYYWRNYHKGANTVAVSPDGTLVVSGGRNGDLQLWNAASGVHLAGPWKQHNDRVWSVCLSPDGSRLASCSADGTLIIWDAHSRLPSGRIVCGPLQTGHGVVRAVAYCPKGGRVATSGHNSTINIWDDNTGDLQVKLDSQSEIVPSVAWTVEDNILISGSIDGTVQAWDISQKTIMWTMRAHEDAVHCIVASNHVFATASADQTISLWTFKTRHLLGSSQLSSSTSNDEAYRVALTTDENTIIACTKNGKIYTIDIKGIISDTKAGASTYYVRLLVKQFTEIVTECILRSAVLD